MTPRNRTQRTPRYRTQQTPCYRTPAADSAHLARNCFFIIDFNDVKAIKWINKRVASVFREWKHDLSEIHKLGGRDVISEELLHRRDEWEWLCTHFESDKYKRRSVANSSNRGKKKLEHHSGRKPIIYRVAKLRDKGSSLPVVDVYPVTYDINQPTAAEHYIFSSSYFLQSSAPCLRSSASLTLFTPCLTSHSPTMAAACPTPQKKKTTRLSPPKRGKIKARILGNLVKAVVSMVKHGDQGKKMATEAGGGSAAPTQPPSGYNSYGSPNVV
ncbi:hypothetical protein ACLB2K_026832 [Fragaria x ananassa]